jgi:phosphohistidine swiveling domain-containing protein
MWGEMTRISRPDLPAMESHQVAEMLDSIIANLRRLVEFNLEASLRSDFFTRLLTVRLVKLGMDPSEVGIVEGRIERGVTPVITGVDQLGIPIGKRAALALHQRAVGNLILKEQVGAAIDFGNSLCERCFRALGEQMVRSDLLLDPVDVMMLSLDEVRQIAQGGCSTNTCNNYRLRVMMRKRELADAEQVMPLAVVFGERAPVGFSSPGRDVFGRPGAGGYRMGSARRLQNAADIKSLESDEVAFLPDTGIEWTPVLDQASALVVATGSMFSDLLFLARERSVPVVIGADSDWIRDGSKVSVDGYQGVIRVMARESGWEVAELPDLSRPVRS